MGAISIGTLGRLGRFRCADLHSQVAWPQMPTARSNWGTNQENNRGGEDIKSGIYTEPRKKNRGCQAKSCFPEAKEAAPVFLMGGGRGVDFFIVSIGEGK